MIDGIRSQSIDEKVWIRANLTGGGTRDIQSDCSDWLTHPDDRDGVPIDVAVLRGLPPPTEFDVRVYQLASAVTEETIRQWGIGAGDEVFLTGLFVSHYGRNHNSPIIRVGNIAAMADEPIETKMGPMVAHLIEARSIGGLSGSPVFVHLGGVRVDPQSGTMRMLNSSAFYLLGIMHGHWTVKAESREDGPVEEEAVNMGIGIVVPVERIAQVINQPTEAAMRRNAEEEERKRRLPVLDSTPKVQEANVTKGEFETALKKVSRRRANPSPPDEESSGT